MAKHWMVRIGVRDPLFRTGEGSTATEAAIYAYGMKHNTMFCKPVTMAILRSKPKLNAAWDNPLGWTGFVQRKGKLLYDEAPVDNLDWTLRCLAAWEDGYECSECGRDGLVYLPGYTQIKCVTCGEVNDVPVKKSR